MTVKISGLTAFTGLASGDLVCCVDGSTTKKITVADFFGGTTVIPVNINAVTGGFGIARTDGTLHVHTGTAGAVTADTGANDLIVENSAQGGISILTPDANAGIVYFGTPGDAVGASVVWDYGAAGANQAFTLGSNSTNGQLVLRSANAVEAVRIDSSQNVGIGVTAFGTNATNVLGIKADGTVPSSSPAGMIQIFADDTAAGATTATLAIRTEETVTTEVLAGDSTLNIWVNGTEYHLIMRTV